jgi:hypothetical protein
MPGGKKRSTNIEREGKNMFCPLIKMRCPTVVEIERLKKIDGEEFNIGMVGNEYWCIFYLGGVGECQLPLGIAAVHYISNMMHEFLQMEKK